MIDTGKHTRPVSGARSDAMSNATQERGAECKKASAARNAK
jgi:hypothetical protein